MSEARAHPLYEQLLDVSVRLGVDPLQIQGPGGNTSLKLGDRMFVKASGAWLAEARRRDVMVPVRWRALHDAMAATGGEALDVTKFVEAEDNPSGLRPSIETTVHAALRWPVVLHTHCVATIAVAVRTDAAEVMRDRLGDIPAVFAPYAKPGVDLAKQILARARPDTRAIVLGNHGLAACGETPVEAERLLREVADRLGARLAESVGPKAELPALLDGTGWRAADGAAIHDAARDPARLAMARGGALYPDHVIFLGPGVLIAHPGESPAAAVARAEAASPDHKLALLPGLGAAIPQDASPSTCALTTALGDVLARVDPGATLTRLTTEQELELLNWDAEKYRQALERARAEEESR